MRLILQAFLHQQAWSDMNLIKLDFEQGQHSLWRKLGVFLAAVGLMFNSFLFIQHQSVMRATDEAMNRLEGVKHPINSRNSSRGVKPNVSEQNLLNEAAKVMTELNYSWPTLFNQLELTLESNVNLLEVKPNAKTDEVMLVGLTENLEQALAYMARLEKTAIFKKIELKSHEQVIRSGVPKLQFTIQAKWQVEHE